MRVANDRLLRSFLVLVIAVLPIVAVLVSTGPALDDAVATSAHGARPSKGPRPTATVKPTVAPTPTTAPTPTVAPTPTPSPTQAPTTPPSCTLFPSTNVWNKDISTLPVRGDSAALINSIGLTAVLHPDFSSTAYNGGVGYGIPFNVVNSSTPRYPVSFYYPDESDPGPYPIPASPKIEGDSDRHLLSWDAQGCYLYEIYDAALSGGQWTGGSGAIWDLRSNALRPDGWTSADAAGLPILPGLVRYDEVAAGAILHALRFTAPYTARSYVYPARHQAGCTASNCLAPMGLRVRLKASVDISGFPLEDRIILTALKRYGMLLADNGSPFYITGAPDPNWNDSNLHLLQNLHGSDFEAIDTSGLVNG